MQKGSVGGVVGPDVDPIPVTFGPGASGLGGVSGALVVPHVAGVADATKS